MVTAFFWIKDTSQFNEYFIKTIMKKVMKDIFMKLMFNTLKNYIKFIPERMKIEKVNKLKVCS